MSDAQQRIDDLVKGHRVVLFMKGTAQFPMCGFSGRAIQVLKASGVSDLKTVNVLEDEEVRQGIKDYANWPTIPQLYVNGEFVGGSDIMMEMYQSGELQQVLGGAVHVRAQVEHMRAAAHRGKRGDDRRAVYAGQRGQHETRRGHECAGVACADAGLRLATLDQVDRHAH